MASCHQFPCQSKRTKYPRSAYEHQNIAATMDPFHINFIVIGSCWIICVSYAFFPDHGVGPDQAVPTSKIPQLEVFKKTSAQRIICKILEYRNLISVNTWSCCVSYIWEKLHISWHCLESIVLVLVDRDLAEGVKVVSFSGSYLSSYRHCPGNK